MTDEPGSIEPLAPPLKPLAPPIEPIEPLAPPLTPTDGIVPTADDVEVLPPPPSPPRQIPLVTTRRLLPASFDLLIHSTDDLRRASFYIGAIVVGTVGPTSLTSLALEVIWARRTEEEILDAYFGGGEGVEVLLLTLAIVGLIVAFLESRTMAIAVLGSRMVSAPLRTRQALARSRVVFWRTVLAAFIVGIVVSIGQAIVGEVSKLVIGDEPEVTLVVSVVSAALIGAPFAYALSGVVLGDVGPMEAVNRSIRVFRARRAAAALVVLFETAAFLLIALGLFAGLDIAIRVFDAAGLDPTASSLALAITTIGLLMFVFAFGTLIFTVTAITVAPQVIMFLGLTHADGGLDTVRPGGAHDPSRRGFRWFSRPMLVGFVFGAIGLVAYLSIFSGP